MTEEILEEIDKIHKKEGHIKRADIDSKGQKTLAQLMDEEEHALDQFAFLIFIPNPMTQMVRVIVDDGFITLNMKIDRLLNIVESICDFEEMKRIRLCCKEYGTPYLYDREMKHLTQVNERVIEERITAKKMKDDNYKEAEEEKKTVTQDSLFEKLKEKFNKAVEANHFQNPQKKKSFINYNKKEVKRYY